MRPRTYALAAAVLTAALMISLPGCRKAEVPDTAKVGPTGSGRAVLPVNQMVTPAGRQVSLPGLRPQALALSPDGKILAVSGKTSEVILLDPASGAVRQRVPLPAEPSGEPSPGATSEAILSPDTKGQLSYTGLAFSPDGRRLYLSNVNGSLKVFAVEEDGTVRPSHSILLPPADAPKRREEIPAGLAFGADGQKLYVCGNLSNRLLEMEAGSGAVLRFFEVGVAPFDVVLAAGKAYVSNWGGPEPTAGDVLGPAGQGTVVGIDPATRVANKGSVSVIDLASGAAVKDIPVHLHPCALAVSPDGRYIVCANAASDNLSVIDTADDAVVETIWVKTGPADPFGASPNALTFVPGTDRLYVANGTQNAVAVIRFRPSTRRSEFLGLIPAGWFPGALLWDEGRKTLAVANIKGLAEEPRKDDKTGGTGFNSHQYHGSISFIAPPGGRELKKLTAAVYSNFRRERIAKALLKPRPGRAPRPVPERIGEPSVFKHVVYVIKENRTYDQVLGDIPAGDGDPSLTLFGERATPNQHKMVREFALLDNTYCSGLLSADGHQWSTTAFGTDYLERSFAGWPRSYPDGMGPDEIDALAYAPTGFIWDNALRHGVTLWDFGEFTMETCGWKDKTREGRPSWLDYWDEYVNASGRVVIGNVPAIETLAPYSPRDTVGWNMAVPDVWRARYITNQIAAWDRKGRMPQLVLICLPDDHTSGTSEGSPTPEACAADNDLAFGRIVEAIGRSQFWKDTVIFGIEDDPQNGFDHVSGYRTTAYCVSPYTKRGAVVATQYNTTSILRTIEQILGLPPMNQFDATAVPMADCFTDVPDLRPFVSVPNNIPLDTMNPPKDKVTDRQLRRDAAVSARLNFRRVDACPEDVLNRILWRAVKGSAAPYPAWAVTAAADDRREAKSSKRTGRERTSASDH